MSRQKVDIDDFKDAVIEDDGPNGQETEKTIAAFRGMLECFPNLFPEGTAFGVGYGASTPHGIVLNEAENARKKYAQLDLAQRTTNSSK